MRENHSYFAALIIVLLAALLAALLFVVALVVWLAGLMGTLLYPCLIVGLFMTVLAVSIYKISLRSYMRELHERVGAIYDVTTMLRDGGEWVKKILFQKQSE